MRRELDLCVDFNSAINIVTDIIDEFVRRKGSGSSTKLKHITTCTDFLKICFLRIIKNLLPKNFDKLTRDIKLECKMDIEHKSKWDLNASW